MVTRSAVTGTPSGIAVIFYCILKSNQFFRNMLQAKQVTVYGNGNIWSV